jgi:hypothetical protein
MNTARQNRFGGSADFDPLFKLNHACAKIRADLACMACKTWAMSKKRDKLQDRLDIYVAVNNGYSFSWFDLLGRDVHAKHQ